MGKTAEGAVWLNKDMLSSYDYWQYWRNTEDADVGRFLRLFSEMPTDEIAKLESLQGAEINDAKKTLADHITALCHGADAARDARDSAERTFEQGQVDAGLPTLSLARQDFQAGIAAFELFVRAGLSQSNGEARRLIRGGGARLNDAVISEETQTIGSQDIGENGALKLSAGKKRHLLVRSQS